MVADKISDMLTRIRNANQLKYDTVEVLGTKMTRGIADILKRLSNENKISKKDLYELKESEVIDIIESSKYNDIFNIWKNAKKVKLSKEEPKNVYYVHHGAKIRYIDPLFNGERISKCCKIANKMIENNLSYDMNNYVYLDFNF